MGLKLKNAFSWKGLAGLALAPFTGGASLALTAKSAMDDAKKDKIKSQTRAAEQQMVAGEMQGQMAAEERRRKKMAELEEKNKSATGIASLLGGGNELG